LVNIISLVIVYSYQLSIDDSFIDHEDGYGISCGSRRKQCDEFIIGD